MLLTVGTDRQGDQEVFPVRHELIGSREVAFEDESVFVECSYIDDGHGECVNVRFTVVGDDGEETCTIAANLWPDREGGVFSRVTFEGSPEKML